MNPQALKYLDMAEGYRSLFEDGEGDRYRQHAEFWQLSAFAFSVEVSFSDMLEAVPDGTVFFDVDGSMCADPQSLCPPFEVVEIRPSLGEQVAIFSTRLDCPVGFATILDPILHR